MATTHRQSTGLKGVIIVLSAVVRPQNGSLFIICCCPITHSMGSPGSRSVGRLDHSENMWWDSLVGSRAHHGAFSITICWFGFAGVGRRPTPQPPDVPSNDSSVLVNGRGLCRGSSEAPSPLLAAVRPPCFWTETGGTPVRQGRLGPRRSGRLFPPSFSLSFDSLEPAAGSGTARRLAR